MRCERYWQDGILQIERGETDPHHRACLDCRRAHRERERLVRALSGLGAGSSGDPGWQARVWRRIACEPAAWPRS
ncbi:MAG: hypothetical protein E6J91_46265 [Deltaproteobacteria bacterium]|nr:MAG: hypothetical protein E6J91_46265 [Deltaproteobacteria bacterium]